MDAYVFQGKALYVIFFFLFKGLSLYRDRYKKLILLLNKNLETLDLQVFILIWCLTFSFLTNIKF